MKLFLIGLELDGLSGKILLELWDEHMQGKKLYKTTPRLSILYGLEWTQRMNMVEIRMLSWIFG